MRTDIDDFELESGSGDEGSGGFFTLALLALGGLFSSRRIPTRPVGSPREAAAA